jgi:hypothetical protein
MILRLVTSIVLPPGRTRRPVPSSSSGVSDKRLHAVCKAFTYIANYVHAQHVKSTNIKDGPGEWANKNVEMPLRINSFTLKKNQP